MDIILLPFIGLILASIQQSQNLKKGHLGKNTTNNLKGISIIFIILHHINQELGPVAGTFFASRLSLAGRLGVAIFSSSLVMASCDNIRSKALLI